MIRSILVAIATLVAITTAGNAQVATLPDPQRPSLKSEAIINGDIVRIGDLIEHAGIAASVPIFRAPDLGDTGAVAVETVLEAVRKHGLIGVNVGDVREVVVTRASRTIPASEIEDAITKSLSARFDLGSSKDIVVTFARDMRAIHVEPSAKGEPRVANIDYDLRSGRFEASGSWQSRSSRCIARQPSPRRLSTFSSIPCETWKRDTNCSGGDPISRLKVFRSQFTKLCSGGFRRTTFLPSRAAFSLSRMFSMTCSGAWTTTKPRSSNPLRPARPAIW